MKKIQRLLPIILLCFIACNDDDDNSTSEVTVDFTFSHHWDDIIIDQNNLTTINVTNANGETLNFTRLRYLVSRFQLERNDGTTYAFNGYKFTDMSDADSYNFTPSNNTIPTGTYTLKFIWGFNEEDNINGAYLDLNSASWNWPAQLGGGYHFLQMDGQYNSNTSPSNYNYHNGMARVSENPPVYEQNFAEIALSTPIEITSNTTINIEMNIAEFFKNPHTWDLNVYDTPLMPNYTAQKMMQDNVATVFSLGTVSQ